MDCVFPQVSSPTDCSLKSKVEKLITNVHSAFLITNTACVVVRCPCVAMRGNWYGSLGEDGAPTDGSLQIIAMGVCFNGDPTPEGKAAPWSRREHDAHMLARTVWGKTDSETIVRRAAPL